MNHQQPLRINLASRPLRNRRLFFMLLAVGALGILFLAVVSGSAFVSYKNKNANLHSSLIQVQEEVEKSQNTHNQLSRKIKKVAQKHRKKIDRLNEIIHKKSFSWVDFLSALENSLPSSCYIVSLSPSQKGESQLEVRFRVVSPHLDELLKFIDRMNAQNFKKIRVISESKNEKGDLISEISFAYES